MCCLSIFLSVFYPLFLVIFTFVLVELHAHNCRIVVCCWKPFHLCFVSIRRNWSASDSVVYAFTSLLLLSFAILNYNAYELLKTINIYNANGDTVRRNVLFNHPSKHLYSHKYAYFGVVVVTLLFFFGICPSLLLLLYPIRYFRVKLQRCCSQRLQITMNMFVETIHGPFKDGCNGTHDFRTVAGLVVCLILLFNTFCCLAPSGNYINFLLPVYILYHFQYFLHMYNHSSHQSPVSLLLFISHS